MARVVLRDDPGGQYDHVKIRIDDSLVDAELAEDPIPSISHTVNPLISVKDRVADGFDVDGNPTWTWVDRITNAFAVTWMVRTEVEPRGGMSLLKATVTFLYPMSEPDITPAAMAKTSDGHVWSVRSVERYTTQVVMAIERVDDGD